MAPLNFDITVNTGGANESVEKLRQQFAQEQRRRQQGFKLI